MSVLYRSQRAGIGQERLIASVCFGLAFVAGIPGQMDKSDGDKNEAHGRKGEVLDDGQYKTLEANLPPSLTLKQWCEQADQGMRQGLERVGL
ncbi:hypothetical protein [Pseudomonas neuropathica]|uniref:hypothetical protein n=1 Tax=Pseudomonas neuropathica TaxID=2730425 RepID=UPI001E5F9BD2|nr:hypothetical protein [Pseudomonas neuropathica]